MKTFISTMPYGEDLKSNIQTGWGCGYVHIPKDHPILVKLEEGWGKYLEPDNCPEEITFTEWDKDKEHLIIGFDTAHGYNNDSHDEQFVINQSEFIKSLVDAYTAEDARNYALNEIESFTARFSKYL